MDIKLEMKTKGDDNKDADDEGEVSWRMTNKNNQNNHEDRKKTKNMIT